MSLRSLCPTATVAEPEQFFFDSYLERPFVAPARGNVIGVTGVGVDDLMVKANLAVM